MRSKMIVLNTTRLCYFWHNTVLFLTGVVPLIDHKINTMC